MSLSYCLLQMTTIVSTCSFYFSGKASFPAVQDFRFPEAYIGTTSDVILTLTHGCKNALRMTRFFDFGEAEASKGVSHDGPQ